MSKVLIYDIETSPIVGYTWGVYKTNVLKVLEESHVICFAYKWLGEKKVHFVGLNQFPESMENPKNDRPLVGKLHSLFDEADIIIAHNGDKFDRRKSNARFLIHGMKPPSPYKTIDTLKMSRKDFAPSSHRLNSLGIMLDIGKKVEHEGFINLYERVLAKDPKVWKMWKKYNDEDVRLLEKLYIILRPWMVNHPNLAILDYKVDSCVVCTSPNLNKRGMTEPTKTGIRRQRHVCMDCGKWMQGRIALDTPRALIV